MKFELKAVFPSCMLFEKVPVGYTFLRIHPCRYEDDADQAVYMKIEEAVSSVAKIQTASYQYTRFYNTIDLTTGELWYIDPDTKIYPVATRTEMEVI